MSRARFDKRVRLLTPAQFDRSFKEGRRVSKGALLAIAAANQSGHPRIGFAVAKKHIKRAVQRNRLKRVLREKFRLDQHRLSAVDLVVFLRSPMPEQAAMESAAEQMWAQVLVKCASC